MLSKIIPIALGYIYEGKSRSIRTRMQFYNSHLKVLKPAYSFGISKSKKILKLGLLVRILEVIQLVFS